VSESECVQGHHFQRLFLYGYIDFIILQGMILDLQWENVVACINETCSSCWEPQSGSFTPIYQ
jgi:hypothetical protein